MHINVLIPTYNRLELLLQTIKTIRNSHYKDLSIFVIIDGNEKLITPLQQQPIALLINKTRRDWVYSINRALQFAVSDAVIYASDDLKFSPVCIGRTVARLQQVAPDTDALIAIKQNIVGCSTAFGLLGRKFIERFPGRRVMCPDYIHFGGDSELGRYARHIGKLFITEGAEVIHERLMKDETHRLAKTVERRDFNMITERRKLGLLWGRDPKLITQERK